MWEFFGPVGTTAVEQEASRRAANARDAFMGGFRMKFSYVDGEFRSCRETSATAASSTVGEAWTCAAASLTIWPVWRHCYSQC